MRTTNNTVNARKLRRDLRQAGITTRDMSIHEMLVKASALGIQVTHNDSEITATTATESAAPPPTSKPETTPTTTSANDSPLDTAIRAIVTELIGDTKSQQPIDEKLVIELIAKHGHVTTTHNVELKRHDTNTIKTVTGTHSALADVLRALGSATNCPPYLVGPAGSGKTTLAAQAAEALELDFYFTGAILAKYELLGFIDANGKYHETAFRQAFECGGLFLFDEVDGSAAQAVLAFNQAIENRQCAFPDKIVYAHKDFKVIAAANTVGTGATRQYIGRNQLDGATLDRFLQIDIDYDEAIEAGLAVEAYKSNGGTDTAQAKQWHATVLKFRTQVETKNIPVLVTPRATKLGAAMLAQGMEIDKIKEGTLYKHLSADQRKQLGV